MKIAILIQSNDDYDHLWEGLYLSWKLNWNWNRFYYPVYVITETKNFFVNYKDNDFNTIKVGSEFKNIKYYSNKLLSAIDYLQNLGYTHILYSQDDSWPLHSIDSLLLQDVLSFIRNNDINCFYMHEHFRFFPFTLENTNIFIDGKRLRKFKKYSRFFYNHGNAFWNLDYLKKIQAPNENPSDNEPKTTERVWNTNENFYLLNVPWYDQSLINNKGVLLDTAANILKQLRFRYKWEKLNNFSDKFVSNNSYVIENDIETQNYFFEIAEKFDSEVNYK